ncbi:MAG: TetR/AcrR family transcriptional regulator [Synergistaceae bacterium]|jgi:AcrR family transcriptional regulator|nr:TetR/AcrR family transcriptional regulator [Synergistaceae bacterium]NCC56500.1 TetR/AcrR family transcriptional regulator [Synergistales bacterium]MDD3391136.1 TetR/AcrR family transcriptional regulator [Synergistaceae bacterium]MDD3688460.1 TetR/AcrR family transcriptional regulator [Synergistaceae bacterium]MDD4612728.1 TetR/AcrR family transcriptional regulator [Synergistaceae bacterium]
MAKKGKYLPAEERRAVIVETVLTLAAEGNPSEITTAAIADRMGLTQGALFRHFSNKDAIWEAVMTWVSERLLERVDHASLSALNPLEGLEAVFFSHISFIDEYPGVPGIFFGELQRSEDSPARRQAKTLMEKYSGRILRMLDAGKKAGLIDKKVESRVAAGLFIGIIQGLVLQSRLSGAAVSVSRNAAGVFALFRRGIEEGDQS